MNSTLLCSTPPSDGVNSCDYLDVYTYLRHLLPVIQICSGLEHNRDSFCLVYSYYYIRPTALGKYLMRSPTGIITSIISYGMLFIE